MTLYTSEERFDDVSNSEYGLVHTFTSVQVFYNACRSLTRTWTLDQLEEGPGYFERTYRLSMIHFFSNGELVRCP